MSLSIQLVDSISQIEKNINAALAQQVNNLISKKQTQLINGAKSLASNWIKSQPEIISLQSSDQNSLVGLFGIPKGSNPADAIVNAVTDSITIKLVPYNNRLKGGLELYFQPDDFKNLLSLPQGHTPIFGGDLHWLDWLLKRGDSIIIANYQYNPGTGLGRSGLGNMISGGSFRVPPQFSGTQDDNFVTRALIGSSQEKEISDLFQRVLGS